MYDIIPDIHGQLEKLTGALKALGYSNTRGAWRHPDSNRRCIFLGDYIDRGPENAAVIRIVRDMVEAGTAFAIMGNHELNAIHFHTHHPESGLPLRNRLEKNLNQHGAFLKEFALGSPEAGDAIAWMKTLPLFLEFDDFRVVHACWDEAHIDDLRVLNKEGRLSEDQFVQAATKGGELFQRVETVTKGPELALPEGYSITDKDGTIRHDIRLQWWKQKGARWSDIAISVPDLSQLPQTAAPDAVLASSYSPAAKPVFCGHYWLSGAPVLQAPNVLCLDYSAGRDGPLVTYSIEPGTDRLTPEAIKVHMPHANLRA
jgi:hypothetical protein